MIWSGRTLLAFHSIHVSFLLKVHENLKVQLVCAGLDCFQTFQNGIILIRFDHGGLITVIELHYMDKLHWFKNEKCSYVRFSPKDWNHIRYFEQFVKLNKNFY